MAKKKILIVDDEKSITTFLKFVLEKTGLYEVSVENAGSKAVSVMRTLHPDLLILDLNMPDLGGGEVASLVQADPALRETPIIFLTGNVTHEEAAAGLVISGHPALGKPLDMEQLLQRVRQSLII